ncbi:Rhodanese-like domain-containing protein isoform 2 [Cladophialophora immunda]|nr:Rhodanese-like domain-containing protein isoform 1 [Cladophialophora immunda]OQV03440.1 Rhodanese-like domain-containing protein isoform 2 [Cladophialophora immunda]
MHSLARAFTTPRCLKAIHTGPYQTPLCPSHVFHRPIFTHCLKGPPAQLPLNPPHSQLKHISAQARSSFIAYNHPVHERKKMTTATSQEEKPWHAHFPAPRETDPQAITREDLLERFRQGQSGGRDFLLVDLRRNDHAGGTIKHSINLPAQTLYFSLAPLYNLCTAANIPLVIFYCGSSRGRGSRAAGWLADYIADQGQKKATTLRSVILKGGIKGWVDGGDEYTQWMDAFEAEAWKKGDGQ